MDVVMGGVGGGVIGAIVAVNVAIYAGPDEGYEASIRDLFEHNTITGIATIAVLLGGPLVGIAVARRIRRQRPQPGRSANK